MFFFLTCCCVLLSTVESLTCLSCRDVQQPRHCHEVESCTNGSVCGTEQYLDHHGRALFNLGCMTKMTCSQTSTLCFECCDTDLCNSHACGQPGYPLNRGPICYDCSMNIGNTDCMNIAFCQQNEICSIQTQIEFGDVVSTQGCSSKLHCNLDHSPTIIGRREAAFHVQQNQCDHCCSGDLCNKICVLDVDGSWGDWSDYSTCSVTCGTGHRYRNRTCDNPSPSGSGHTCAGSSTETSTCSLGYCNVDGSWGDWSDYSTCSVTCGTGHRYRNRTCDNPSPSGSGHTCAGSSTETSTCSLKECAADCYELLHNFGLTQSGVYSIVLPTSQRSLRVYCDMNTNGGGWTVFQHRASAEVDFYRNMSEYVHGFGNLSGNFWLGLEPVYELLSNHSNMLYIKLEAADNSTLEEQYANFSLSSGPNYTLHIGARTGSQLIASSYSLSYNNGYPFSTPDHDRSGLNCSDRAHGSWWYRRCTYLNLNGEYVTPGTVSHYFSGWGGMIHFGFKGVNSLKMSTMLLKRV